MDSPVQQRVLVIGGGIAGNSLALLLKQKGWQPIVLEKVKHVAASGLGLVIQSNGMKVLNQAGAVDLVLDGTLPWQFWNDWSYKGEFLGGPGSKSAGNFTDRYGWPSVGVSRTRLQLGLKAAIEKAKIPFFENWKLKDIKVGTDSVTAISEEGHEIEGAFVVGADGLKSATRDVIFARHNHQDRDASFTGIEVIGGTSPSPQFLKDRQGLNLFWGPTETIITHPIEDGIHIWGATVPVDGISRETWRTLGADEVEGEKQKLLQRWKGWHPVVAELVSRSTKMQSIGLYDRGNLDINHWFHDRMMVIGDAAHPTTPHAGQGANQCLEDAWVFFDKMPNFEADSPVSTERLRQVFQAVAENRQPKTSDVMHKALKWGEDRVLRGDRATEAGEQARNEALKRKWNDLASLQEDQDNFLKGPFEDVGGYQRWVDSKGEA